MLAFVLNDQGPSLQRERPRPEPAAGYVRVRPLLAGVCNTDMELARGYMDFRGVLGHEFVGQALDGALAGRRVVGGINFACGQCPSCLAGLGRHCPTRTVLGILGADGVFAEEFVIPEANLSEVPDAVDTRSAVFAEPLAAACEILDQLAEEPGGRALVLGAGKLGPLIAQVLAASGFRTTLAGRHLDGLQWLAEREVELLQSEPGCAAYDLVVEATGSSQGLTAAIAATRPRGTLVLKTTVAGAHTVDLSPIVINEISVVGSRCGRFAPALDLLAADAVDVEPLIASTFALADIEDGFRHAGHRGVRKVLIGT